MRTWMAVVAFIAAIFAWPERASAHRPVFVEPGDARPTSPHIVQDPTISWAFYGDLRAPDQRDHYLVRARRGLPIQFSVLVPQVAALRDFRPSVSLVGPGLSLSEQVPFPLPPWAGAVTLRSEPLARTSFYERFTQIDYWAYPEASIDTPAIGDYQIVVWSPDGRPGRYVLAVGSIERFDASDVFLLIDAWVRARAHADRPVWYGVLGAALALTLLVTLTARLFRRRSA